MTKRRELTDTDLTDIWLNHDCGSDDLISAIRMCRAAIAADRALQGEQAKGAPVMNTPSLRDTNLSQPGHLAPPGDWYQNGYSWGWNDCIRWMMEQAARAAQESKE